MDTIIKSLNLAIRDGHYCLLDINNRIVGFNSKDDMLKAFILNGKLNKHVKENLEKSANDIKELADEIGIETLTEICVNRENEDEEYWWDVCMAAVDYLAYKITLEETSYLKEKHLDTIEYTKNKDGKYIELEVYGIDFIMDDIALDFLNKEELAEYQNKKDINLINKGMNSFLTYLINT